MHSNRLDLKSIKSIAMNKDTNIDIQTNQKNVLVTYAIVHSNCIINI